MKKERATTSDEQRERLLIAEQIGRAAAEAEAVASSSESPPPVEEGLKRDEGANKVVLSFSAKPTAPITTITSSASAPSIGFKVNPLKSSTNPLKRPNVFKMTSSAPAMNDLEKTNDKKRPASSMTAAERLIIEDQERKRRRMDRESAV